MTRKRCCCGGTSSNPSSSSPSSESSSSESSQRNLLPCFFCDIQGGFSFIRAVIEVTGWPPSVSYFISGYTETITGMDGRNRSMTLNWPIVDNCPGPSFEPAQATDYYEINVTRVGPGAPGPHFREERTLISGGNFPQPFYVGQSRTERNTNTGLREQIAGVFAAAVRDPVNETAGGTLELCKEIQTGFEYTMPINTIFGTFLFNITVIGYMEIGLT